MSSFEEHDLLPEESADLLKSSRFRRTASNDDFDAAVQARMIINTAVGIIMGKHDCSQEAALGTLRRAASTFTITELDFARALVTGNEKESDSQ
jgi:AmiR/NasT family two-component response regulator